VRAGVARNAVFRLERRRNASITAVEYRAWRDIDPARRTPWHAFRKPTKRLCKRYPTGILKLRDFYADRHKRSNALVEPECIGTTTSSSQTYAASALEAWFKPPPPRRKRRGSPPIDRRHARHRTPRSQD
jgi:hypothetical protein